MNASLPILYSFRRCPYAMRARLAVLRAGIGVELREVLLRDKPQAMIDASPKATVPVLVLGHSTVIDESRDIAIWALSHNDPAGWLGGDPARMAALIDHNDGAFKKALDRYKYPNRYPDEDIDRSQQRAIGAETIQGYEALLSSHAFLMGDQPSWPDMAILPFVRQFAHVERDWFWSQDWPHVIVWLERFLASDEFDQCMMKFAPWSPGDEPIVFGEPHATICRDIVV